MASPNPTGTIPKNLNRESRSNERTSESRERLRSSSVDSSRLNQLHATRCRVYSRYHQCYRGTRCQCEHDYSAWVPNDLPESLDSIMGLVWMNMERNLETRKAIDLLNLKMDVLLNLSGIVPGTVTDTRRETADEFRQTIKRYETQLAKRHTGSSAPVSRASSPTPTTNNEGKKRYTKKKDQGSSSSQNYWAPLAQSLAPEEASYSGLSPEQRKEIVEILQKARQELNEKILSYQPMDAQTFLVQEFSNTDKQEAKE